MVTKDTPSHAASGASKRAMAAPIHNKQKKGVLIFLIYQLHWSLSKSSGQN